MSQRIEEEDLPFGHRPPKQSDAQRRVLASRIETIAVRVRNGGDPQAIAIALAQAAREVELIEP